MKTDVFVFCDNKNVLKHYFFQNKLNNNNCFLLYRYWSYQIYQICLPAASDKYHMAEYLKLVANDI